MLLWMAKWISAAHRSDRRGMSYFMGTGGRVLERAKQLMVEEK